jgi:hypothetical protein
VQARRPVLPVDEEHVVPFAPTARLVGIDVQIATRVVAFPARFEDDEIIVTRRVKTLILP